MHSNRVTAQKIPFGGSCHKDNFCHDKTCLLLQQKYACHDKASVATKSCSKFLLRQNYVCCDKCSVVTSIVLSWQKHDKIVCCNNKNCCDKIFLSQQAYFCHDKRCVCCDKHMFVMTNTCLSWQNICCDKNYTCGSSRQWQEKASAWKLHEIWMYCHRLSSQAYNNRTGGISSN